MPRILIIDDDQDIRSTAKRHLVNAEYEVVEAEDGEKAIEKINAGDNPLEIDTVICDLRMPKINGMEAISYFQKNYPTLPLIVVTGFPETELAVRLLKQGVHDYLVKPVEKIALLAAVDKAVKGRVHNFSR